MFPKQSPGLLAAVDLCLVGQQRKVKPTYTLYRNVIRSFGERHQIACIVRRWAWLHWVFRNSNPYPMLEGGYDFSELTREHQKMAEYVADRTMDQKCGCLLLSRKPCYFVSPENLFSSVQTTKMPQTQQLCLQVALRL